MNKKKKVGIATISKSMTSLIRKLEVAQNDKGIQASKKQNERELS